jgi:hypothetical protein
MRHFRRPRARRELPAAAAEHWRDRASAMVPGAPCGSECTCVPERWQHVPGRVVLTIDQAGRVHKETRQ